jgi:hypothetical protein
MCTRLPRAVCNETEGCSWLPPPDDPNGRRRCRSVGAEGRHAHPKAKAKAAPGLRERPCTSFLSALGCGRQTGRCAWTAPRCAGREAQWEERCSRHRQRNQCKRAAAHCEWHAGSCDDAAWPPKWAKGALRGGPASFDLGSDSESSLASPARSARSGSADSARTDASGPNDDPDYDPFEELPRALHTAKKSMPVTMGDLTVLGGFPAFPADTPGGSDTEDEANEADLPLSNEELRQRLIPVLLRHQSNDPDFPETIRKRIRELPQHLNEEIRELLASVNPDHPETKSIHRPPGTNKELIHELLDSLDPDHPETIHRPPQPGTDEDLRQRLMRDLLWHHIGSTSKSIPTAPLTPTPPGLQARYQRLLVGESDEPPWIPNRGTRARATRDARHARRAR